MNVKDLLSKYAELNVKRAAVEEAIVLIRAEFSSRDGVPPNKIVLTHDGKRVPTQTFNDLISDIGLLILAPIDEELTALEDKKING